MTFQRRRPRGRAGDAELVDRFVQQVLAFPPSERLEAFTTLMVKFRDEVYAASPRSSARELAAYAEQLGLRVLDQVTSAAHRRQLRDIEKKSR